MIKWCSTCHKIYVREQCKTMWGDWKIANTGEKKLSCGNIVSSLPLQTLLLSALQIHCDS